MKTKSKYTRKQILESIKYWKNKLKIGDYEKLNEPREKAIYVKMYLEGSYGGNEHEFIKELKNTDISTIENVLEDCFDMMNEEHLYAFIDPKTHQIVDNNGLDYRYLAVQLKRKGSMHVNCSYGDDFDDFDLSSFSAKDLEHGHVTIKFASDDEIEKYNEYIADYN